MYQLIATLNILNKISNGISDLLFAALPSDNGNQNLHLVANSLYREVSLTCDQYSRSTATAKQDNAYEIPIPLLMFDSGTDEKP